MQEQRNQDVGAASIPEISVVIPVYNERDAIETTVRQATEVLNNSNLAYEMVLVDDGSTDGSRERVEAAAQECGATVITHDTNRGYGAALKTGILAGTAPKVLITDADGTYPIDRIPALVEASNDRDMVVGHRSGADARIPMIRRPAKWVIKNLAEYLSDQPIPDLNSGFRVFPRDFAIKYLHILPNGFSFTTTLTLLVLGEGRRTTYIPIGYAQRTGKSKIKPIRDTLNFFHLILRTTLYINPLRVFLPAALAFLAIAAVLYIMRVIHEGGYLVTIVIAFNCGFQLLVLGLVADLIDRKLK
jgi:glycosyltransferase involved in cell wall biosynthesis